MARRRLGRNGLVLARPLRPVKKGSRRSPDSRWLGTAIATRFARAERTRERPLSTGRQSRARSDASELRQEHLDFHDMGTFDSCQETCSIATFWNTSITQSSSRMEETRTSYARLPLPFVGLMAMVGAALHVISCSSYVRPSELLTLQARETRTTSDQRGCPAPTLGSSLVSDRARCSQQIVGLRRIGDAQLPVDDLGRSVDQRVAPATAEPLDLAFRPACPHRNPLHRGTSQRCFPRSGIHCATAERRTMP